MHSSQSSTHWSSGFSDISCNFSQSHVLAYLTKMIQSSLMLYWSFQKYQKVIWDSDNIKENKHNNHNIKCIKYKIGFILYWHKKPNRKHDYLGKPF